MEYPFRTDKVYFSGPEERHLKEFLAQEPQPGKVYVNEKGERRLVMDIILPEGVITKLTAFADGGVFYHTPCAKWVGVVAMVDYELVGEAGGGRATSEEWLKWIGASFKVNDPEPPVKSKKQEAVDNYISGIKKSIAAGREPVKTNFNDLEEGWHSPTDNQKTLPKEKPKKKHGGSLKKGL
jgi:hypothetical protein